MHLFLIGSSLCLEYEGGINIPMQHGERGKCASQSEPDYECVDLSPLAGVVLKLVEEGVEEWDNQVHQ